MAEVDTEELSTRDRIIKEATRLIQNKSYNSISYNDISEAIGIKKASIHYYFQTKEILGAEIISNYSSKIRYLTQKLDRNHPDPVMRLEKYFDWFAKGLEQDLICPAAVFSVELNTLPPEILDEHRSLFEYYISWLSRLLRDGLDQGSFAFKEPVNQKAEFIASLIEGALLFSRTSGNVDFFERVVVQIKDQILK